MRTLLTLVVDDAKVLPILRAIEHIGAEQLDIKPIKERAKALPAPTSMPRGHLTQSVLAVLASNETLPMKEIRKLLPDFLPKQLYMTLNRLKAEKKVKKLKEGWRINGS